MTLQGHARGPGTASASRSVAGEGRKRRAILLHLGTLGAEVAKGTTLGLVLMARGAPGGVRRTAATAAACAAACLLLAAVSSNRGSGTLAIALLRSPASLPPGAQLLADALRDVDKAEHAQPPSDGKAAALDAAPATAAARTGKAKRLEAHAAPFAALKSADDGLLALAQRDLLKSPEPASARPALPAWGSHAWKVAAAQAEVQEKALQLKLDRQQRELDQQHAAFEALSEGALGTKLSDRMALAAKVRKEVAAAKDMQARARKLSDKVVTDLHVSNGKLNLRQWYRSQSAYKASDESTAAVKRAEKLWAKAMRDRQDLRAMGADPKLKMRANEMERDEVREAMTKRHMAHVRTQLQKAAARLHALRSERRAANRAKAQDSKPQKLQHKMTAAAAPSKSAASSQNNAARSPKKGAKGPAVVGAANKRPASAIVERRVTSGHGAEPVVARSAKQAVAALKRDIEMRGGAHSSTLDVVRHVMRDMDHTARGGGTGGQGGTHFVLAKALLHSQEKEADEAKDPVPQLKSSAADAKQQVTAGKETGKEASLSAASTRQVSTSPSSNTDGAKQLVAVPKHVGDKRTQAKTPDAARVQAVKPPAVAPKDVDEKQARATTAGAAREQAATRRSNKLGAQSGEDGSNRLFASVSSWERKLAQRANMQLGEAAETPPVAHSSGSNPARPRSRVHREARGNTGGGAGAAPVHSSVNAAQSLAAAHRRESKTEVLKDKIQAMAAAHPAFAAHLQHARQKQEVSPPKAASPPVEQQAPAGLQSPSLAATAAGRAAVGSRGRVQGRREEGQDQFARAVHALDQESMGLPVVAEAEQEGEGGSPAREMELASGAVAIDTPQGIVDAPYAPSTSTRVAALAFSAAQDQHTPPQVSPDALPLIERSSVLNWR